MSAFTVSLRLALRRLRSSPGFALSAVACLALGIGANTAVFSFVDHLLINPLPAVAEPSGVVSILARSDEGSLLQLSEPDLRDVEEEVDALSEVAAFQLLEVGLGSADGTTASVPALRVTEGYFTLLGVPAARGRNRLDPEEPGTVVVSHRFWRQRLGGARDVLGRTLHLDGRPYTVVGVAPEGFRGTVLFHATDLWLPLPRGTGDRQARVLQVLGRIAPGADRERLEGEIEALGRRWEEAFPTVHGGSDPRVQTLLEAALGGSGRQIASFASGALFAVVGLVLLIACINVASLLLARNLETRRQASVQMALGAGRGRITLHHLVEGLLLALAGAVGGLLVAAGGLALLARWGRPPFLPPTVLSFSLDGPVLLFALGVSVLTVVLFTLTPAFEQSRLRLAEELKEGGGRGGGGRRSQRLRRALVVIELAASLVILVAAGLFLRSLDQLGRVELGFDGEQLGVVTLDLGAAQPGAIHRLLGEAEALPGVRSAAVARRAPLSFTAVEAEALEPPDAGPRREGEQLIALVDEVTDGYFETLGLSLLRGRGLRPSDRQTGGVAVVNRTLAERLWPGEDPLGRRVPIAAVGAAELRVVGVVADAKQIVPWERPRPTYYVARPSDEDAGRAVLLVRSQGAPEGALVELRQRLAEVAPEVAVLGSTPMPEVVSEALWAPRLAASLFGAFGGLALVLAVTGLYGVIAYSLRQRTREIGVRMALGARPSQIVRGLLRDGAVVILTGLVLGLLLALAVSHLLGGLLFGVGGNDPLTLAGVTVLLAAVALAASTVPALAAARLSPLEALREE